MTPVYLFTSTLLFPCFQMLTMHKLMNTFFRCVRRLPLRYAVWTAYYVLLVTVRMGVSIPPLVLLALNILLVFTTCSLTYRSGIGSRCIFSILLIAVWMLTEVVIGTILSLLGMESWSLDIAGTAISNMFMFIIAVVVEHCAKEKDRPDLSARYAAAVILIPAGTIYLIHHIFLIVAAHTEHSTFAISSSLILLLLNFMTFEVYQRMAKDASAQERNLLYEQELDLLSQQAIEREEHDRQIQRMRHDMRNHMTGLLGMLHDGSKEQAEEYIRLLLKDSADCGPQDIARSGNPVVDAIVNHKCSKALNEGISFDANVFLPVVLPFRAGHLAIVFGNLLDNALEACRELDSNTRWINLEATYAKEVLMVTVSNSCNERKKSGNGKFLTTKKDRYNHGLGLSSVEQSVEPYHGQLETEYMNGTFHAVVVMYGEK